MRVMKAGPEQTVYGLETRSLKARAFTRMQRGVERIEGGYLAFPLAAAGWTLVTVKAPRVEQACGSGKASLLPNAAGTQRICARFDTEGRLTCEIFSLKGNLDAARASWLADGWEVKESAWCDRPGFVLHRGEETIQAIQLSSRDSHGSLAVVIRVPVVETRS
jgi:hypothetical protein